MEGDQITLTCLSEEMSDNINIPLTYEFLLGAESVLKSESSSLVIESAQIDKHAGGYTCLAWIDTVKSHSSHIFGLICEYIENVLKLVFLSPFTN